jgi:hypothetical protein
MISTKCWVLANFVAAILFAATPCCADLFGVMGTGNEVFRIDSTTGVVTRTYPFPDFLPPFNGPSFGLAFDGRLLYLARGVGPASQLSILDVVDNVWLPPALVDTATTSQPLVGLGYHRDEFGFGTLIGVSRHINSGPNSQVFQYLAPPFFDPFLINVNFPPGELPSNLAAHGADVDPATGELWIAADEVMGQTVVGRRIIRSDLTGAVLQTLTPNLPSLPTMIRGLGFDGGAMFIGGRQLATNINSIYEIDRSTGAVIRSFTLPGTGTLNGLAGGEVIPEPGSALLAGVVLGSLATCGGLRRKSARVRRNRDARMNHCSSPAKA